MKMKETSSILLVAAWLLAVQGFSIPSIDSRPKVDVQMSTENVSFWYEDSFTISEKRVPIMAGNWKLNPATLPEASNLLKLLASNFVNHRIAADEPEVVVFPPFPFLAMALEVLEGSGIKVGAQNVCLQTTGAFTGEV
jgi:hypothetical protein